MNLRLTAFFANRSRWLHSVGGDADIGIVTFHRPPRANFGLSLAFMFCFLAIAALAGCTNESVQPGVTASANRAAAMHSVAPNLATALGNLARASSNKCQLSFLASFKGLSSAAARFNSYMGKSQKALLVELQHWAQRHHLTLRHHRRKGLFGTAEKLQSSSDAHALLTTSGINFEHLYLLLMFTDYSWQIQLDKAALQFKTPPVPITYLKHALKVNRQSLSMIERLLFHATHH